MKKITCFQKCCQSPWYALLVTLSGVTAGYLGSIYSAQISAQVPFVWKWNNSFPWITHWFWIPVIVFGVLFFLRQTAMNKMHADAQDELVKLIRTMPPKEFLTEFEKAINISQNAALQPNKNVEETEDSIRNILDGITTLAYIFDGRPEGVVYSANIMTYEEINSFTAEEIEELESEISFIEPHTKIKVPLKGILKLQLQLHTTTAENNIRDYEPQPLILPVPVETQTNDRQRSRIIPGAPLALIKNELSAYINTDNLITWCEEKGDFSPTVCQAVKDYFNTEKGVKIRSFVSFPLYASDDKKIGVLNVHSDKEGMLCEDREEQLSQENQNRKAARFYPLIVPFKFIIIELLLKRNKLKNL